MARTKKNAVLSTVAQGPLKAVPGVTVIETVAVSYAALVAEEEAQAGAFIVRAGLIAEAFGGALTSPQWDASVAPLIMAELDKGSLGKSAKTERASRFKSIALAKLTRDPAMAYDPATGMGRDAFLRVIRPLLEAYVFPDGSTMFPRKADGTVSKKGPKAGTEAKNKAPPKAPAAPRDLSGSAGKSGDAEGGLNLKAEVAAAKIVLGGATATVANAELLARVAKSHRAALLAFCAETIAPKTPKAPKAPRVPPAKANGATPPATVN